jgi:hypothetical protein
MTALFSKPSIPNITTPAPVPAKNEQMDAELAQIGRRQGYLATLTKGQGGVKERGPTAKAKLTGG